jgi:hypothetical protein
LPCGRLINCRAFNRVIAVPYGWLASCIDLASSDPPRTPAPAHGKGRGAIDGPKETAPDLRRPARRRAPAASAAPGPRGSPSACARANRPGMRAGHGGATRALGLALALALAAAPPALAAADGSAWVPLRFVPGAPRPGVAGARRAAAAASAGSPPPPPPPRLLREDAYVLEGGTRIGYYTAPIRIGSPPRSFNLILDSGSSLSVVPCKSCDCGFHQARAPRGPRPAGAGADYVWVRGAAAGPRRLPRPHRAPSPPPPPPPRRARPLTLKSLPRRARSAAPTPGARSSARPAAALSRRRPRARRAAAARTSGRGPDERSRAFGRPGAAGRGGPPASGYGDGGRGDGGPRVPSPLPRRRRRPPRAPPPPPPSSKTCTPRAAPAAAR